MSAWRWWSDLPPELLAIVTGHLHDVADFVRFHAVCKPWRESLRPTFFHWLIAPVSGREMKLRCVFSKKSYHTPPARERFFGHNWVPHVDGTANWFFSASPNPSLIDPFTRKEKALLLFHGHWMKKCRGVIYDDGTVFLYNFSVSPFTAAILRPGDTTWKFLETQLDIGIADEELESNHFFANYRVHDGKTLVGVDGHPCHLLPPPACEIQDKCNKISEGEVLNDDWCVESSHVLESRGELLRPSVLIERGDYNGVPRKRVVYQVRVLAVSVHALDEEVDAKGTHTARWARRDSLSFADRVMFLGFPTSFALEASRFHGMEDDVTGGCIYFFQRRPHDLRGVFRYNLVERKAKFLGRLPREWKHQKNQTFLWLHPQPSIAPIQVIRERLKPPKPGDPNQKISVIRVEKPPTQIYYNEYFMNFVVWNLPPGVDSSRLRFFFNKHGKVSDAEVTSLGKGIVTMVMATTCEQYEAEEILDGLVLDGYKLEVSKARWHRGTGVRPKTMER